MAKKEKEQPSDDFRYLVRLSNTDLDGHKTVANALAGIKGVHHRLSRVVATHADVDRRAKIGTLTDEQIDALQKSLDSIQEYAPTWMRNRRSDPASGDDEHLIGSDIDIVLREDLNRLKKIRSWRGVRHERKLPVRGQRTKSNGRTGITVGVQRKK